ncbi:NAD(P)-dependent oxidoreductase [Parapedobacter sp. GCM10030251]|uniref:NAD(P)-dependent oxidoreductase n=1 Tax=Parapedobacter sp. GCM10030251 TaxID=3273419 RepID=UPI00362058BE
MTSLIVGASGATGKLLVEQLIGAGHRVKAIVRPTGNVPDSWAENAHITLIRSDVTKMGVDELAGYLKDCQAVASCLGHTMSFKGIFGKPRRLVTDAVRLLCETISANKPESRIKFVLMNTVGNRNRDLVEHIPFIQKVVINLLRALVPPHADNENAADYLRATIGQPHSFVSWVVVRPDSLIDEGAVSEYTCYPSPIRSAILNPGKTSRVNVAHFMAGLMTDEAMWRRWEGQMPVIYNK